MPARSNTMETVMLSLEILRRIPRTGKVSAPEIHKQLAEAGFKRELRTIQRQLDALSQYFGIERDERQKPYGYRWNEHAQGMAMPYLNEQESLLLTLAEQQLKYLLPQNIMHSMAGFFSQARHNLNPTHTTTDKAKLAKEWLSKVRAISVTQPLIPPKIEPSVLEAVSNALYSDHWLNVVYRNHEGKVTESEVMPLGLAQQGPRLYLVCQFQGYDNLRNLALHRIQEARDTKIHFERPGDFNLAQYDADGRFGFGDGKRIRLSFQITKAAGKHLYETPLSQDQVIQIDRKSDLLLVQATVVDTIQLEWWLRGFGEQVQNIAKTPANDSTHFHQSTQAI